MKDGHGDVSLPLPGLEADNLLAFLASLGLLRSLGVVRPEWAPRLSWAGMPPTAYLHLAVVREPVRTDLLDVIADGIRSAAVGYEFGGRRRVEEFTPQEFRALALSASHDRARAQVLSALTSGMARRGDRRTSEVKLEVTPLSVITGAGRQYFLDRLIDAVREPRPAAISRALFEVWRYDEQGKGFRWEPVADRRHAYQFGDPSDVEPPTTVGANQLAALGFSLLTCAPTFAGLAMVGASGSRWEREMVWPLTNVPTSLVGHLALLAHPAIYSDARLRDVATYGVLAVARARRYQVGKYFNFERARLEYVRQ